MTVRGQVLRAELYSTNAGAKGQLLRAELYGLAASETVRGQLIRAELYSLAVAGTMRAQLIQAQLYTQGANATAVSPSGPVPSFSNVTIAAAYSGSDPTPDFEWRQLSGPPVVITENDVLKTATVKIPAQWGTSTVVIQARVLEAETATDWATCTLTVKGHDKWQIRSDGVGGALVDHPIGARKVYSMPGSPEVPLNPDPVDPVTPPAGTPTVGLWFTALGPGVGTFKGMPHFYGPFPISVSNDDHPNYHERVWLKPAIEGQTDHRVYGGYTRDRPYDKYDNARPQPTSTWRLGDAIQNVEEAALYGMDGFWLEMLGDINSANNVRNLAIRDAANQLYPGGQFKASPMPDMNSGPINAMTADQFADLIAPFAVTNPTPGLASYTRQPSAWYLPDNRFVFSCFRGDVVTGAGKTAWPQARWQAAMDSLLARYKVNCAFIIGVNSYPAAAAYSGANFYGFNHWGSGADPGIARGMTNLTNTAHSRGQVFMGSVWPSDIRPYVGLYDDAYNTETVRGYLERMVADGYDYAQLTTWSDYSEGGMWQRSIGRGRVLAKIWSWYSYKRKLGVYPTILRDEVILCHRNQSMSTTTYRYDTSGAGIYTKKMTHWDRGAGTSPVRNNIEVLTFLLAPATVNLKINGTIVKTYTAPAGMNSNATTPIAPGVVSVDVVRSGVSVGAITSPFTVQSTPFNQNPMYYLMDSIDGTADQYDPVETLNP